MTMGNAETAKFLTRLDQARRDVSRALDPARRARLGQFMTPAPIAYWMASRIVSRRKDVRLLDPGAGIGSLAAAFIARAAEKANKPRSITAVCYEVDATLVPHLRAVMRWCRDLATAAGIRLTVDIRSTDYLADRARAGTFDASDERFDCAILNPPYRKINSDSPERQFLRQAGIETTNLYAGFMLLAARHLRKGGEFVSITPRSFCNGTYFRPFRKAFLSEIGIREIHVLESRSQAFEDEVLQENVIVSGLKGAENPRSAVLSMTAADGTKHRRVVPYRRVVDPRDPDAVVHVGIDEESDAVAERLRRLKYALADIGLSVSTGRVVDFRARDALRAAPTDRTVPLIYPAHFHDGVIEWPNGHTRKPNAIIADEDTMPLLVQRGNYVVVKRFSAKEERRRVVAALYAESATAAEYIGFENHLNYFHEGGRGIQSDVARGLVVFLNSTILDKYFRQFSGHTQVNAADLRTLRYPARDRLAALGRTCQNLGDQHEVDAIVHKLLQSV